MLAGCWSWTSWCFICWLKVDESTTCWFEIRKLRCHGGLTSNLACCTRVCNFKGWLNHNKGLDHRLDSSRCPCPASSWLVYCWILSASVVFPCIVTNFSPFPRRRDSFPCSPGLPLGNAGTGFLKHCWNLQSVLTDADAESCNQRFSWDWM